MNIGKGTLYIKLTIHIRVSYVVGFFNMGECVVSTQAGVDN